MFVVGLNLLGVFNVGMVVNVVGGGFGVFGLFMIGVFVVVIVLLCIVFFMVFVFGFVLI